MLYFLEVIGPKDLKFKGRIRNREFFNNQWHIVAKNRRKQDEVKQNSVRVHSVKKAPHTIKRGISFENIIYTVANLQGYTKTMKEYTESSIQGILYLFSDTLKYTLFLLGRIISDLPDLKKRTVAVDIAKRWVKRIIEEGSMHVLKGEDRMRGEVINYMRSRQRTDQRVWYIVLFWLFL